MESVESNQSVWVFIGPPAMVAGLYEMLQQAGINDDDIRKKEFTGY
jgi:hypothetical protein